MPIPKNKHPAKCKKCGGKMEACFTIFRTRMVKANGTLGDWTDGGTIDLDYYRCVKCDRTEDILMKCSCCGRRMNTGTAWGEDEDDYVCSQLPDAVIEEKLKDSEEEEDEEEENDDD